MALPVVRSLAARGPQYQSLGSKSFHHKSTDWHSDFMTQTEVSDYYKCPAALLWVQAGQALSLQDLGRTLDYHHWIKVRLPSEPFWDTARKPTPENVSPYNF